MPAHAFFRGVSAALICASLTLSCATAPPATTRAPAPVETRGSPPIPAPQPAPVIDVLPAEAPPASTVIKQNHIALLLPVEAPDFRPAAEAFIAGFQAARFVHGHPLPVRLHGTDASPETITKRYVQAVESGARVVIGPMTRNAVTALSTSALIVVPTLSLNQPDANVTANGLYVFGLSAEAEAAVVAQAAFDDGYRNLAVANSANALARRTRDAFVQAWRAAGGNVIASMETQPDNLTMLRELGAPSADIVFLAANFEETRQIRPYLPSQLPVYTTSQINLRPGDPQRDIDLDGVRFVDMPWLLSPDDPRVTTYPPAGGISSEMLRFYALGIDAYRIATALADGQRSVEFDGVTGRISVSPNGNVDRIPARATFRDGFPVPAR